MWKDSETELDFLDYDYFGYTGAAEPQFRCGVSHLSGTTEPPFNN